MYKLSEEQKQKIANALKEKGVDALCPMCRQNKFILADGYFNHSIQSELNVKMVGGPTIPTIAMICANCGFTSQHALGVLDILGEK